MAHNNIICFTLYYRERKNAGSSYPTDVKELVRPFSLIFITDS